jgi:RNA polymerase subunit RPABC4/transcription elongation factor Spt4
MPEFSRNWHYMAIIIDFLEGSKILKINNKK